MSQCCPGKRRPALILLACLLPGLLGLSACSKEGLRQAVTDDEEVDTGPDYKPVFRRDGEPEVLRPVEVITGGQWEIGGRTGQFTRILTGSSEAVRFQRPVAVAGHGDIIYIVDAGERGIYKYDRRKKTISTLGEAGKQFAGDPSGLAVERDLSFYVADPQGKRVFYFDANGHVIRIYSDLKNLSRPMDLVYDEISQRLLVADGSFSHVVVFDKLGQSVNAIGSRGNGPGHFRAMTAIDKVGDSLYIADRLELPVQEMDMNGVFRFSFGEGILTWPTSLVMDKFKRVYVSDRGDNTIKVFDDIRLIATLGGTGSAHGRFRLITDMWMSEDGFLYVADSLNRRVQVFEVVTDKKDEVPVFVPVNP